MSERALFDLHTPVAFVDLMLGETRLSFQHALRMLGQKRTHVFCALSLVILFSTDPSGLMDHMAVWKVAMIWPIALVIYLVGFFAMVFVMIALRAVSPRLVVYTPICCAAALYPSVLVTEIIAEIISDTGYQRQIGSRFVLFFLAVQALELTFIRFVLSGMLPQITRPAPETKTAVTVAGEKFDAQEVLFVEARQHFVHIHTEAGMHVRRARLSDVISQIDQQDGIQPHRSWWVARRSEPQLQTSTGKPVLILRDGTEIAIARARVPQVEAWLNDRMAAE